MDYIKIKTTRLQDYKTTSGDVIEPMVNSQQLTAQDVKELLKDWIKLYPNSFAPDVEFKIYQLADGDIIIQLHEDLSSMAVSLLVLYFENIRVRLGDISNIDDKIMRLKAILPELEGQKVILRMENYEDGMKNITFNKDS